MKENLVDINELVTIISFGKAKGISRQRIYKLIEASKVDWIEIDGCKFIYLTEKTKNFKKQV